MNISNFFNIYPGIHILQAFLHSLVAAVIIDRSIYSWAITSPLVRQRFRLIAVIVPVFSYPLYQLINPERGSLYFRLDALFDSGRWLNLELWGKVPLSVLFIFLLVGTTAIFLLQEFLPILSHAAESRRSEIEWDRPREGSPALRAIASLPGPMPDMFIADDEDLLIYSTTGKNPAIFLSTGLIATLEPEELEAAISHEVEHIRRGRRPLLMLTYFVRVLQFFSPATLVEFRKMVEDEEKICDDSAVEVTGNPGALAGALKKLRHEPMEPGETRGGSAKEMVRAIETYSHDMLLKRRIQRLQGPAASAGEGGWVRLFITMAAILAINYFIV
jgi:Zn-dependent protease with chaperone function